MAIGDNYCTIAELKTRLGISDAVDDGVLTNAVATSSRQVENYCRRQFNDAGSVTARTYHPTSCTLTIVDDFSTTTGLVIETDTSDSGTFDTTWAATSYSVEPVDGVNNGLTGWPYWRIRAVSTDYFYRYRRPSVRVTAQWGWAAVPAPVKEATLALAEEIYKMKDSPYGIAGFGEFGFVRVRENPKIVSLLKDYRRSAARVA